MTTNKTADEAVRAAFENWFSDEGESPRAIERSGENYVLMLAQSSWIAFRAGNVATQREAQEPIGYVGRHIAHAIQGGSAGLTTITQRQAFDDDVALYAAPQPPSPCPRCEYHIREHEAVYALMNASTTELEGKVAQALAAKHQYRHELRDAKNRIADLEAMVKTVGEIGLWHVRDLETRIAEQAALIEQYRDTLALCEGNISSLAAAHPKMFTGWLEVVRASIPQANP